jgi:uncharacterized membrane protein YvlD (DUF360 family)
MLGNKFSDSHVLLGDNIIFVVKVTVRPVLKLCSVPFSLVI